MSATQEQIVASAAELIWRQGYHNTSVDQIIQEADVCKGNFYYYFPSKVALGLAVIDAWFGEYEHQIIRPNLAGDHDPAEAVECFIDASVQAQRDNGFTGCPLGRIALEMGDLDESFRQRLDECFETWRRYLQDALGRAGVEDAPEFSRFLIAALQGGFLLTKVGGSGAAVESIAQQLKAQLRMRLAGRLPSEEPVG